MSATVAIVLVAYLTGAIAWFFVEMVAVPSVETMIEHLGMAPWLAAANRIEIIGCGTLAWPWSAVMMLWMLWKARQVTREQKAQPPPQPPEPSRCVCCGQPPTNHICVELCVRHNAVVSTALENERAQFEEQMTQRMDALKQSLAAFTPPVAAKPDSQ